jgi:hypothetical protein
MRIAMDDRTVNRTKKAATDAAQRVQESSLNATEVFRDYQLKIFAAAQENIVGTFEYIQDVMRARSFPELLEISTTHSQRQLSRLTEQAQEISGAAQKLASESARPFGRGLGKSA